MLGSTAIRFLFLVAPLAASSCSLIYSQSSSEDDAEGDLTLELWDTVRAERIQVLEDGDVIPLPAGPSVGVTVVAQVDIAVGSVRISGNGSSRVPEERPPYSLGGDSAGELRHAESLGVGQNEVSAAAFSEENASGVLLAERTVRFQLELALEEFAVTTLSLVGPQGEVIAENLSDNDVVAASGEARFAVATDPELVGSVRVLVSASTDWRRASDWPPYVSPLFPAEPGTYVVEATPFSLRQTGGVEGTSAVWTITLE